jgi:replicative DNA helicase
VSAALHSVRLPPSRLPQARPASTPKAMPRTPKATDLFQFDPDVLPHFYDAENEAMALGAMLSLDGDATALGVSLLHERHFCIERNRDVFRAIKALHDRARLHDDLLIYIEPAAVGSEMRRQGTFAPDWTAGYLASLAWGCPCAAIIRQSAQAVRRCAALRFQMEAARVLAERLRDCDAEPPRLQEQMMNALALIERDGWCDCETIFQRNETTI